MNCEWERGNPEDMTYACTEFFSVSLFATVEIGGVPEIAPDWAYRSKRGKTHLHHIFEKTGTKRQADLVKVVAASGVSGPFRPEFLLCFAAERSHRGPIFANLLRWRS